MKADKKAAKETAATPIMGVGVRVLGGGKYQVVNVMPDGHCEPAGPPEKYVSVINRSRTVFDKMLERIRPSFE